MKTERNDRTQTAPPASAPPEWLKDQRWIDTMQDKIDFALDILKNKDATQIHEASLHIAVKQMSSLLADFDPATFIQKLTEDPASYARILRTLSKITEEDYSPSVAFNRLQSPSKNMAPLRKHFLPFQRLWILDIKPLRIIRSPAKTALPTPMLMIQSSKPAPPTPASTSGCPPGTMLRQNLS